MRNRVRWGGIDCAIEVAAGGCLPPVDWVQAGAAAVPAVLAALAGAGAPAASVAVARPSLDEVYLRYTGRRYSQAQEEETPTTRRPRLEEVTG